MLVTLFTENNFNNEYCKRRCYILLVRPLYVRIVPRVTYSILDGWGEVLVVSFVPAACLAEYSHRWRLSETQFDTPERGFIYGGNFLGGWEGIPHPAYKYHVRGMSQQYILS